MKGSVMVVTVNYKMHLQRRIEQTNAFATKTLCFTTHSCHKENFLMAIIHINAKGNSKKPKDNTIQFNSGRTEKTKRFVLPHLFAFPQYLCAFFVYLRETVFNTC